MNKIQIEVDKNGRTPSDFDDVSLFSNRYRFTVAVTGVARTRTVVITCLNGSDHHAKKQRNYCTTATGRGSALNEFCGLASIFPFLESEIPSHQAQRNIHPRAQMGLKPRFVSFI